MAFLGAGGAPFPATIIPRLQEAKMSTTEGQKWGGPCQPGSWASRGSGVSEPLHLKWGCGWGRKDGVSFSRGPEVTRVQGSSLDSGHLGPKAAVRKHVSGVR